MPPKQVENLFFSWGAYSAPRTPSWLLSGPTGHHLFLELATPLLSHTREWHPHPQPPRQNFIYQEWPPSHRPRAKTTRAKFCGWHNFPSIICDYRCCIPVSPSDITWTTSKSVGHGPDATHPNTPHASLKPLSASAIVISDILLLNAKLSGTTGWCLDRRTQVQGPSTCLELSNTSEIYLHVNWTSPLCETRGWWIKNSNIKRAKYNNLIRLFTYMGIFKILEFLKIIVRTSSTFKLHTK